MDTNLVGGTDIAAHVAALQEQLTVAQSARNDAADNLKSAKAVDTDNAVEAMRAGKPTPKPTEPAVEAKWNDAERHLTIVSLALKKERDALTADITARADDITADLATKADEATEDINVKLDEVETLLGSRADILAHRTWVRQGATGKVNVVRHGDDVAVRALRASLAAQASSIDREAYLRNYDAWKALVEAATVTVTQSWRDNHHAEEIVAACDKAIEREVERRTDAGEDVPTPTSVKWGMKLGIGNFAGTRETRLPVEPDLDSAKARHSDNVREVPA